MGGDATTTPSMGHGALRPCTPFDASEGQRRRCCLAPKRIESRICAVSGRGNLQGRPGESSTLMGECVRHMEARVVLSGLTPGKFRGALTVNSSPARMKRLKGIFYECRVEAARCPCLGEVRPQRS